MADRGLTILGQRGMPHDPWTPFDEQGREGLAMPFQRPPASGSVTPASGTMLWIGGAVIEPGAIVEAATFQANAKAESPTHQWFALAIPDEAGAEEAAVIATTKDDTTTAWEANKEKTLSFKASDGGSGAFQAKDWTPLYIGICQVATTPATLRGIAGSGQVNGAGKGFPAASSGPASLVGPGSIASVIALNPTASCPWAFLTGKRP